MADSKSSRTLPAITRRKMLGAPAALVAPKNLLGFYAASASPLSTDDGGPAMLLWFEWHASHSRYVELSTHRQNLEIQRFRNAGFPDAVNLVSPSTARQQAKLRADLAAVTKQWDDTGYSQAVEAETKAEEQRSALATSLFNTPVRSIAGAAAKLDCFIGMNRPIKSSLHQLHPEQRMPVKTIFPELRGILTDLVMMGGVSDDLFRE